MTTVSIVMPVHNGARYIVEAIESVLAQSMQDWELIVVDDESTDCTRAVVEAYVARDCRIRLVGNTTRTGSPAGPRNTALDMVKGRFVAFLDSDDYWEPEKLELQVGFMQQARAVISYTAHRRVDANGELLRVVRVPVSLSYEELLKNSIVAMSSAMYDRQVVGEPRFAQQGHEDFEFWLRLVKRHSACKGLDTVLMNYRVVKGSVSSGVIRSVGWTWRIYRDNAGLSWPRAMWCLFHYGWRAVRKRISSSAERNVVQRPARKRVAQLLDGYGRGEG